MVNMVIKCITQVIFEPLVLDGKTNIGHGFCVPHSFLATNLIVF